MIFENFQSSLVSPMFVGYFRFEHEGVMKIGYFNLFDGNQFYSVWLFTSAQKVTDRNDPLYVVEKPQMRYVPEVILECYRTFAVDFNTARWPDRPPSTQPPRLASSLLVCCCCCVVVDEKGERKTFFFFFFI